MILILTEEFDVPTINVIKKLDQKGVGYRIIYGSDFFINRIKIDINNKEIIINGEKLNNINIVWYRRWLSENYIFSNDPKFNAYLKNEFEEYSANFMNCLSTKKWLNHPPYMHPYPSKAKQLRKAIEYGLEIPASIVTNNKEYLNVFYNNNGGNIITKNLSNPYIFKKNELTFATYTSLVNKEDINELNDNVFFSSIFQENIPKEFEIRIFYFKGVFFSYAIFSMVNKQTETDHRIYDFKKPNRIMRFDLPNEISSKIHDLMADLNLHTGSIDLIKTTDDRYVFLEVNPQGQFGGLDYYGLKIEDYIANYLIENDRY